MTSPVWPEPVLEADDIQGNVLPGFNTRCQRLVGFRIRNEADARSWIRARKNDVATLAEVAKLRNQRRDHHQSGADPPPPPPSRTLLNLTFSYHGLKQLIGDETDEIRDQWFKAGMWEVADSLGDDLSETRRWALGSSSAKTPHVLAILGDDDKNRLDDTQRDFIQEAEASGLEKTYDQSGERIPLDPADSASGFREHFGFRDGISVPAVRGVLRGGTRDHLYTRELAPDGHHAKPGQVLLWPGQLIFGYPAQDPDNPIRPAADATGGPSWMRNGSFLVFRRLRQDVAAFHDFVAYEASRPALAGVGADRLRAMLVGRWPNGTPLVESPHAARAYNPDDSNDFGFLRDLDGRECPLIAHIRKVNPRDAPSDLGGASRARALQIFRRGIPWGKPYEEDAEADRGLLFLAYMTEIEERFGRLQRWMNRDDGPEQGRPGLDLLAGQSPGKRSGRLPVGEHDFTVTTDQRWVIPTGGGFFFSPSVSLLGAVGTPL